MKPPLLVSTKSLHHDHTKLSFPVTMNPPLPVSTVKFLE
jgi:hypothetical protein